MPPKKPPKPTAPEPEEVEPDEGPAIPVAVVEPEADEGTDEVQLVRTGFVRLRFGDTLIRLRRPFFGELKKIRLALEDAADAIADASEEAQLHAARLIEQSVAIDADENLSAVEKIQQRRELQHESRAAGRKVSEIAEEERLRWWATVVETIGVGDALPGVDELPSWILDPMLPNTVLTHWRSVPLGRG